MNMHLLMLIIPIIFSFTAHRIGVVSNKNHKIKSPLTLAVRGLYLNLITGQVGYLPK
jgi:hypothetical protein